MARLNLDDADLELVEAIGNEIQNQADALKAWVDCMKLVRRFWLNGERRVPKAVFAVHKLFLRFVDYGLVQEAPDGFYFENARDRFNFLTKTAQQIAGEASADARKKKFGSAQPQKKNQEQSVPNAFEDPLLFPEAEADAALERPPNVSNAFETFEGPFEDSFEGRSGPFDEHAPNGSSNVSNDLPLPLPPLQEKAQSSVGSTAVSETGPPRSPQQLSQTAAQLAVVELVDWGMKRYTGLPPPMLSNLARRIVKIQFGDSLERFFGAYRAARTMRGDSCKGDFLKTCYNAGVIAAEQLNAEARARAGPRVCLQPVELDAH